jgi:hypothetical protein
MVEYLDVDREGLFEEIVETGREEGVTEQEAYNELIDTVIEDHRRVGEMHDDSSYEGIKEALRERWPDYREALGLDTANPEL